uniref:Cation channel complex component UNC80 N-terminal domain-containing protein n=1 Tax=Ditylenchus dipsaci TaxID=166011 RepID=A0A915D322_9BILA
MHARYLQHQYHGTVQLLMMPLSSAPESSFKSSKWSEKQEEDESAGECEPVPLPIQTFLWRQTNPFLGTKTIKLHEASCVTFERVIVQNILHGLSPSLSDAIASISRWRLVKAAFPHIVQCCGSLLMERANEDEALPMTGSLVKILYIMHWLLLDAVMECNENTLGDPNASLNIRQLTYSISSIQLFVYLLSPLFSTIKEEEIEGHIRLESGLRIWQALWQNRSPDVLCFCAPVKQRKNTQIAQQVNAFNAPWSHKLPTTTAIEQGIYLGDEPTPPLTSSAGITGRKFSKLSGPNIPAVPPPKPPRTDLNVLKEIQQQEKTIFVQEEKGQKGVVADGQEMCQPKTHSLHLVLEAL